jgi:hypothetical protein
MPMKSLTGAMRRPFRTHPVLSMAHIGDMVGYFSVSSPPCSCTKIGKRPTAGFAKQMLQMPGVVSSLPPLEADAFHMAKTDDDFHLKCPLNLLVTICRLRWPRGGRPIPIDWVRTFCVRSLPYHLLPQKHTRVFS